MHNSMLAIVGLSLVSRGMVHATTICAYTSRDCIGNYGCCKNIPEKTCCSYPNNYGWSTKVTGLPASPNALGYTYGDTCHTNTGGAGSSDGVVCISVWNSEDRMAAKSANWVADWHTESAAMSRGDDTTCSDFDIFGFTDDNGNAHEVSIPSGLSFYEVEQMLAAGKVEELLALKKAAD